MGVISTRATGVEQVERWPSELPLFGICLLVSIGIYALLTLSIIGLVYVAMFGVFFFIGHAMLVAHVRGSAVRLGPQQFPELYDRVQAIARRIGLEQAPDAYLMQANGALNAFATRFVGANLIVLFADLLDACGDNEAARDMIIAHELGHIKAGHVQLRWLIAPSLLIPFLGTALSRAREYTCDRYGLVGAGDRPGALLGLTILAAGGARAGRVNQQLLAQQRSDLNTGWVTIGEWLGTHPPLAKRLAALEPRLLAGTPPLYAGRLRAGLIVGGVALAIIAAAAWGALQLPRFFENVQRQAQQQQQLKLEQR